MSKGVEIFLITLSFAIYLGYQIWFLRLRSQGFRSVHTGLHHHGLFNQGKIARVLFNKVVVENNDTILGIQQGRNVLLGSSFLTATCSLLAQQLLRILLDEGYQHEIREIHKSDPIVGGQNSQMAVGPLGIVSCAFMLVILTVLAFAHTVRMYGHLGYFQKAGSVKQTFIHMEDIVEVALQGHLAFSLAVRLLFFFPPMALWIVGPTALLIGSVLCTAAMAWLDCYTVHEDKYMSVLSILEPDLRPCSPRARKDGANGVAVDGDVPAGATAVDVAQAARAPPLTPLPEARDVVPGVEVPATRPVPPVDGADGGETVLEGAEVSPPQTSRGCGATSANGAGAARESGVPLPLEVGAGVGVVHMDGVADESARLSDPGRPSHAQLLGGDVKDRHLLSHVSSTY